MRLAQVERPARDVDDPVSATCQRIATLPFGPGPGITPVSPGLPW